MDTKDSIKKLEKIINPHLEKKKKLEEELDKITKSYKSDIDKILKEIHDLKMIHCSLVVEIF